jgi:hypothetical protein
MTPKLLLNHVKLRVQVQVQGPQKVARPDLDRTLDLLTVHILSSLDLLMAYEKIVRCTLR